MTAALTSLRRGLADSEQTKPKHKVGCVMELVILIGIFLTLADTGGGKAGW